MKTSSEVMKSMQNLIKLPELQKITQDLSKEMVKAGIIDEMINDSLDAVLDDEDTDDLVDEEVEKILLEVTQGKLKDLPSIASGSVGTDRPRIGVAAAAADVSDEEEADDMTRRLEALRT
jgi:charged multivesicular body protein 3